MLKVSFYAIMINQKANQFYRGCQKNVPIEDRFSATTPYAAILFSEHYYGKRYKYVNLDSVFINVVDLRGEKIITETRKHENTKYFKIFFILSCFGDKKTAWFSSR